MSYKNFLSKKYHGAFQFNAAKEGYPCNLQNVKGKRIYDLKLYGNSVQDGTPSPDTPIEIQSVGDLVTDETSEYYGKYDIPVTSNDETVHIYLDEPLRKVGDYADYVDWENQRVVKKIGVIDDFSNIKFGYNSSDNYFQTTTISGLYADTTLRANSLCNYFKYGVALSSDCFWIDSSGRGLRIKTDKYDGTTESEFNEWIKSIPIKIYYPLATPTEEAITFPELTLPDSNTALILTESLVPASNIKATTYR